MSRFVLGNCIDVMARIPDNGIDFILTDPPYLVGFRDRQGRTMPAIKPMNGCNQPVMKCIAYSKKMR
uniref:DNA methylase n=1 Tax=Escherichia coli TaxID=562 RepID=A0A3G4RSY6_ECOLX|nr:DNA methylase [Escherichia coli]